MDEPLKQYPLMEKATDDLRAAGGRPVTEINLTALAAGALTADDLRISAETLREQAEVAQAAGFGQLAANLRRAAELVPLPNSELLAAYEALRPGRSTYEGLLTLAGRLEQTYGAAETAAFVREAAEVYRARGLLRNEPLPASG
jgi:propanediol dehydratase small subunit